MDQLIKWSRKAHKHLPWRVKRTLFTTLVSEIMLQQTTVSTVENHFQKFLQKFPTPKALAQATQDEVLIAWKGLGYYRRAHNLKKACEYIEKKHDGNIPLELEQLIAIPGIGDYTASAILAIGGNLRALPVDVNIARVLSRIYGIKEANRDKLSHILKEKFRRHEILPTIKNYRFFFEALMDIGRVFCRAKTVSCSSCPAKKSCYAFQTNAPLDYPGESEKATVFHQLHLLRIVVANKKKFWGEKRNKNEWLTGQIEVPTFVIKSDDLNFKRYPQAPQIISPKRIATLKTSITKYRITNHIVQMSPEELTQFTDRKYKTYLLDATKENISTATLKIFRKMKVYSGV